MSDKDFYDAIDKILTRSLSAINKRKFVPQKSELVAGFKQLIEKNNELRGEE